MFGINDSITALKLTLAAILATLAFAAWELWDMREDLRALRRRK